MFKLETQPTFRAAVVVRRPSAAIPEAMVEASFTAELLWLDDEAHQAWLAEWALHPDKPARDAIRERGLLVSFADVQLEDGTPMPCTEETKAQLLRQAGVGGSIMKLLIAKREEALQGN